MDIDQVFGSAQNLLEWLGESTMFRLFLAFMFVYVVVLIADIVLLLYVHGLKSDWKKIRSGGADRPLASQASLRKEWDRIERRLTTGNPSEYKVAILEADHLTDRVFADMGYKGENFQERLDAMLTIGIEKATEIQEAHQIRNRIIYEPDFAIDKAEAERILGLYRDFLDRWEVI